MYGLYNCMRKEFQFGISQPTRQLALIEANKVLGEYWKDRFEIRVITSKSKVQESYKNVSDEEIRNVIEKYGMYLKKKIGYYKIGFENRLDDVYDMPRFIKMNRKKINQELRKQNRVKVCFTVYEKTIKDAMKNQGFEKVNVRQISENEYRVEYKGKPVRIYNSLSNTFREIE